MKAYLKRATDTLRKLVAATYERAFASKKRGWQKAALIAVVTVAFVAAPVLLLALMLIQGMIAGFFLWLPWTYLEQGARFFPGLDPVWHHLTFWDLTWASSAVIWTSRLVRSRRSAIQPPKAQ